MQQTALSTYYGQVCVFVYLENSLMMDRYKFLCLFAGLC